METKYVYGCSGIGATMAEAYSVARGKPRTERHVTGCPGPEHEHEYDGSGYYKVRVPQASTLSVSEMISLSTVMATVAAKNVQRSEDLAKCEAFGLSRDKAERLLLDCDVMGLSVKDALRVAAEYGPSS